MTHSSIICCLSVLARSVSRLVECQKFLQLIKTNYYIVNLHFNSYKISVKPHYKDQRYKNRNNKKFSEKHVEFRTIRIKELKSQNSLVNILSTINQNCIGSNVIMLFKYDFWECSITIRFIDLLIEKIIPFV